MKRAATILLISLLLGVIGYIAYNIFDRESIIEWITPKKNHKEILLKEASYSDSCLAYVTTENVCNLNPGMVRLMDALYQHTQEDRYPADVKTEIKWMGEYRKKLCAYYEKNKLGNDTISDFAKADTVINQAVRLYAQTDDGSTIGMTNCHVACHSFLIFQKYNKFEQLLPCCSSVEQLDLLYKEFVLSDSLEKSFYKVVSSIVNISLWQGSLFGPVVSALENDIIKARIEMYEKLIRRIKYNDWQLGGVFPQNAAKMLTDCCRYSAFREYDSMRRNLANNFSLTDQEKKIFEELADVEIKNELGLRFLLDDWVEHWDKIDKEFSEIRHDIDRVASNMLIKWAEIASLLVSS